MNYLVVGAGVAGISAVKEIINVRKDDDRVIVFSDESYPFYYRPRLIECLSGDVAVEDIIIHDKNWFDKNQIELKLNEKVVNFNPEEKKLYTEAGEYNYDKLLLAHGAHSFVPPIKGVDKDNIFTLRNARDARKISSVARKAEKGVVIGGGLLGLESAFNLTKNDVEVTVVEVFDYLLPRQLNPEAGQLLQQILEKKGLKFHLGVKTTEFTGDDKVESVVLDTGDVIETDFVLMSTGARPNLSLVEDIPGIKTNTGIIVNEYMETSARDIYAAGDVAEYGGRFYGIWQPAMKEGIIAGGNMVGKKRAFPGVVPSHLLKVVGVEVVSIGELKEGNGITSEVDKREEGYYKKVFKDKEGHPLGAIIVGSFPDTEELIKRIKDKEA